MWWQARWRDGDRVLDVAKCNRESAVEREGRCEKVRRLISHTLSGADGQGLAREAAEGVGWLLVVDG